MKEWLQDQVKGVIKWALLIAVVYFVMRLVESRPFYYIAEITEALRDPLWHFLVPFSVALLVSRGMWGMFSVLYRVSAPGSPKWVNMVVVIGMVICCLLAIIAIGSLSHYFLDYSLSWWDSPLGEPLDLELP